MHNASALARRAPERCAHPVAPHPPRCRARMIAVLIGAVLTATLPLPTQALVRFDFEQRFVVEPGAYIKDHSLVFRDDLYHLYYTVGVEGEGWGQPGNEIDFGHATSSDLVHWTYEPRILGVVAGTWKSRNLWAPHIVSSPSGYHLYYTGVDSSIVQQIGIATSDDLMAWTDLSPAASAYHPDTTWALWSPGRWSNCRDAFVLDLGSEWLLLATASAKAAYAGSERGALALAFSSDGLTWTDAGAPLVLNDTRRVLESPFLHHDAATGRYYLFFTEAGVSGVQVTSSSALLSGWDVTKAALLDEEGFAAEVLSNPEATLLSRVRGVYQPDNGITRGVLIDTLRFAGGEPVLGSANRLWDEWTAHGGGGAFSFQPTYGDRPLGRTGIPSNVEGHFWINTAESYGAPVGLGCHDCAPVESRTGILRSRVFPVTGSRMKLWVGGGRDPENLYVALRRASDGEILFSETGNGGDEMTERTWDLTGLAGTAVVIEIADLAADGHVSVDDIRELDPVTGVGGDTGSGAGDLEPGSDAPGASAARTFVTATPSPSRAGSAVRVAFGLPRGTRIELDVVDTAGRRLDRLASGPRPAGLHRLDWSTHLGDGRSLPCGVYFLRLVTEDEARAAKLVVGP